MILHSGVQCAQSFKVLTLPAARARPVDSSWLPGCLCRLAPCNFCRSDERDAVNSVQRSCIFQNLQTDRVRQRLGVHSLAVLLQWRLIFDIADAWLNHSDGRAESKGGGIS